MRRLASVLLLGLLAVPGQAKKPVAPACPGVSFVLTVADGGVTPSVLTVDANGSVALDLCAFVAPRVSRHRGITKLRARWGGCDALGRPKVRLVVDEPGCTQVAGTLRARRTPRRSFTGVRSSTTTTTTLGGSTGTLPGLFEQPNPWNRDISTLPKSSESDAIIQALASAGGWGGSGEMQIDFSIEVLTADATTPFLTFEEGGGYFGPPDCDHSFPIPVTPGGAIEGHSNFTCNAGNEDCHLIVVHRPSKTLYEILGANISAGTLFAEYCAVTWDLTRAYPPELRGEQCTSADAAGLPIAALLFSADEVAAGEIPHAIRFILPNPRMRGGVYVHPATHAGAPSGGPSLPPYGVRFRLRGDFPLDTLPTEGARVVARAMQRYGMILSDGGQIALTAQSDRFTAHKWDEVGIDPFSMGTIAVTDMEVVDLGPTIPITYDCVRTP